MSTPQYTTKFLSSNSVISSSPSLQYTNNNLDGLIQGGGAGASTVAATSPIAATTTTSPSSSLSLLFSSLTSDSPLKQMSITGSASDSKEETEGWVRSTTSGYTDMEASSSSFLQDSATTSSTTISTTTATSTSAYFSPSSSPPSSITTTTPDAITNILFSEFSATTNYNNTSTNNTTSNLSMVVKGFSSHQQGFNNNISSILPNSDIITQQLPQTTSYPSLELSDDSETMTDSGIGAILQVLLDGEPLDQATSNNAAAAAVTSGDTWATITTDMQYSIVTNLTNITVDLFVNGTYHGVGGAAGGGGVVAHGGVGDGTQSSLETSRYSIHEGILIGIILSLIIFFAVAGNVVVCAAILSDRNLRKTSNYFIISLAVADMLVASMVMSFAVANDILGYWVFGKTFCSVWISLDIMCSTASIVNLCAISLDRYIHIRSPLHYESWVTSFRTCVCISAIWVLSGLMSFVPIHLGWHQLGLTTEPTVKPPSEDGHYICFMELNPWYAVISSIVSFYMPCIVMIAIYLKLYAYARKHVASIKTQIRTPMLQNGTSSKSKQSNSKVADHKAAITLGVIMGTFLFCWTPFFTINIVGAFCPVCIPTVVFQVFTWLGYFNSTLNPIIYSIFNKEFRDAFKRVLSFRRCCHCGERQADFRQSIEYSEAGAYGTVTRKGTYSYMAANNDKVTAV